MFFDRRIILISTWFVITILAQVEGEDYRKSRSINDRVYQNRETPRFNSLNLDDRDHERRRFGSDNLTNENDPNRSNDYENSRRYHDEEEKFFEVVMSKDYPVSTPSDLEVFDRIGERMIARANITEEAKRVVRQVKKQRPGFFWTLARVAFETVNETRSAIEQISTLVAENIAPEMTTVRGRARTNSMKNPSTQGPTNEVTSTESTEMDSEEFKLTQSELQSLIRRNLRGLVRLFNIEWRDALNQSQKNVRDFQRDLGNQISPFLQDNPNVY